MRRYMGFIIRCLALRYKFLYIKMPFINLLTMLFNMLLRSLHKILQPNKTTDRGHKAKTMSHSMYRHNIIFRKLAYVCCFLSMQGGIILHFMLMFIHINDIFIYIIQVLYYFYVLTILPGT